MEDTVDRMVMDATNAIVQYEYNKAIKPLETKAQKQYDKDFMFLVIA